jgi:hypothetical protein
LNELGGTDDGLFLLNVSKLKGLKPISLDSVPYYLDCRIVTSYRYPIPPPLPIMIKNSRQWNIHQIGSMDYKKDNDIRRRTLVVV